MSLDTILHVGVVAVSGLIFVVDATDAWLQVGGRGSGDYTELSTGVVCRIHVQQGRLGLWWIFHEVY